MMTVTIDMAMAIMAMARPDLFETWEHFAVVFVSGLLVLTLILTLSSSPRGLISSSDYKSLVLISINKLIII